MRTTAIGYAMEEALARRQGAAEDQFWQAFANARSQGCTITETQFRDFLQKSGRPLTWRIWNIAIDEAERLVR